MNTTSQTPSLPCQIVFITPDTICFYYHHVAFAFDRRTQQIIACCYPESYMSQADFFACFDSQYSEPFECMNRKQLSYLKQRLIALAHLYTRPIVNRS